MTPIEIEVFEALRRTLAEAAPDALPALLGRLEEERLRGENRLTALVVNGNGRAIGPALDAPDENLSVQEAARRLGISKRWLYRNSDRLPFTVRIGRRVVFSAHKLERWSRSRCSQRALSGTDVNRMTSSGLATP